MERTEPSAHVYGLRVHGLALGDAAPRDIAPDWPSVRLEQAPRSAPSGVRIVDGDRYVNDLADGLHTLEATRSPAVARFLGPPIDPDELAHPYLGPVATLFARWHGREAFHGGAFVHEGRAVAVLGSQFAGKSTLLAALAASGSAIVADDMLVIEDGRVFVGPRTIDLRAEPGPELHGGADIRRARGDQRWRVALSPVAATTRLGAWVFLSPGDDVTLTPVGLADRLQRLARWRALPGLASDPAAMLALAGLPAWDLTHPREWGAIPQTVRTLRGLPLTVG
ncbi:MAG: hypothetical protein JHC95_00745 [Solirubrobacteraceae bacterium]|nr:hypothetical protein [Solirubrobacteraceae bacterium]